MNNNGCEVEKYIYKKQIRNQIIINKKRKDPCTPETCLHPHHVKKKPINKESTKKKKTTKRLHFAALFLTNGVDTMKERVENRNKKKEQEAQDR